MNTNGDLTTILLEPQQDIPNEITPPRITYKQRASILKFIGNILGFVTRIKTTNDAVEIEETMNGIYEKQRNLSKFFLQRRKENAFTHIL